MLPTTFLKNLSLISHLTSSYRLLALAVAVVVGFTSTNVFAAGNRTEMTDQIIVHFSSSSASGQLRSLGLSRAINQRLTHLRGSGDGSHVYKLDNRQDLAQVRGLARALEAVSGVSYAEADQIMQPVFVEPNDQFYSSAQWHYQAGQGGIDVQPAWDSFTVQPTTPIYVAVLDTGYRPHVDLIDNITNGYDFIGDIAVANDGDGRDNDPSDPGDWYLNLDCGYPGSSNSSWHGTHVAGTIAAKTNNQIGVAGVSYNMAKVMPVRVLGKCGGYLSDIADGILWSAGLLDESINNNPTPPQNVAQVINMSLGGSGSCSLTYQNAITAAYEAGVTVVVAAGNANADASNFQPASCNNVITVAASNISGSRSYYSNYGQIVDISAPGGEMDSDGTLGIASTLNDGTQQPGNDIYAYYQGTSMATPHVAGIVALMLQKDQTLTPDQVKTLLTTSARAFPTTCSGCGAGIADAGAVISAISSGVSLPSPVILSFVLDNQDGSAALSWNDSDSEDFYQIQRQQKNKRRWTSWADITISSQDQTSYTDNSGTGTFMYRIRATNAAGSTNWSTSSEVIVTDDSSTSSDGGKPPKACRGKNC